MKNGIDKNKVLKQVIKWSTVGLGLIFALHSVVFLVYTYDTGSALSDYHIWSNYYWERYYDIFTAWQKKRIESRTLRNLLISYSVYTDFKWIMVFLSSLFVAFSMKKTARVLITLILGFEFALFGFTVFMKSGIKEKNLYFDRMNNMAANMIIAIGALLLIVTIWVLYKNIAGIVALVLGSILLALGHFLNERELMKKGFFSSGAFITVIYILFIAFVVSSWMIKESRVSVNESLTNAEIKQEKQENNPKDVKSEVNDFEKMKNYYELYKLGIISEEEFERAKKKILENKF